MHVLHGKDGAHATGDHCLRRLEDRSRKSWWELQPTYREVLLRTLFVPTQKQRRQPRNRVNELPLSPAEGHCRFTHPSR